MKKKLALMTLLFIVFSSPLQAQRLKIQAKRLEQGVKKIAASHHRLWKVARTLWARVQHLEKELLQKVEPVEPPPPPEPPLT